MKKWSLLLLLFLISCTEDINLPIDKEIDNKQEGTITLTLQIPGTSKPAVYAATATDENKITEIDVLAFVRKDGTDIFSYHVEVESSKISDETGAQAGNKKSISFVLKRQEDPVRLVIIANSRTAIEDAQIKAGQTMSAIFEKLEFDFSSKWQTDPFVAFPMWGQTTGYYTIKDPIVETSKPIVLLRSVAKVDVGVDIYGDPALGFSSRFKLMHVYAYNANSLGSITPDLSDPTLSTNIVSRPNIPDGTSRRNDFASYNITSADNSLFNEIYLPEALAPTSESKALDATCLVIGGSYDGGSETYYKINFVKDDASFLPLLRNHRYLVNITSISREGFKTKEEALISKTSHINYSLGVTNENIVDIVFNNQYMLGTSEKNLTLDFMESSNNQVMVVTDYPTGWTASTSTPWISLNNTVGGTNGTLRFDVTQNTNELVRTGVITITAGSLVKDITVRQVLGANCYVVKPYSIFNVPVAMANIDGVTRISDSEDVDYTLLWKDSNIKTGVISSLGVRGVGESRYIQIQAGANEGNAVCIIKERNSGRIVWSWHIWVTNYDPNLVGGQKNYNGTVFMDRNLGALNTNVGDILSTGLVYQWGRKDPFPGAVSFTASGKETKEVMYNLRDEVLIDGTTGIKYVSVEEANNLENSIANPMTFYTNTSFPYFSWYGLSDVDNNLWVGPKGEKTAYDPCPMGWRVPVSTSGGYSVWNGLSSSNGSWNIGHTWAAAGYYPAAGGSDYATGKLADVGARGYVWSASPAGGIKAYMLNVGKTSVNPESSAYRANAYSVRCVKEEY